MPCDALNPLEVLLQLQQCGSLAQAASRLHRTPSALSKIIRSLESEVGHALVEHAARPLRLTDTGRVYAEVARETQRNLREAQDQIAEQSGRISGRLRITASVLLGHAVLAAYVVQFRRQHPEVEIDVELSDIDLDPIRHSFDLAVRHEQGTAAGLIGRPLGSNRVHLVGSPTYFERHGRPQSPAALERHICLAFRCAPLDARWRFHRGDEAHVIVPRGPVMANSDEFLLASVRAGDGLLPCFDWLVGSELHAGALQTCLEDWRFESDAYGAAELWAVYPQGQRGRRKLTLFLDGLVDHLAHCRAGR
ncbi:LysR substrate-binding domain-containing protein [Paucibacter sp. JuS9]|uniref:LysR family transcriptional regulator n=1 Tax=Roseateles TaxID=93681 RepID=UPI002FE52302